MRINLMTDYAIKAIKRIAQTKDEIITSKYIAEKEDIPHGVLMKVLRRLRMAELISSHQGRGEISGGYSLNISVNEITLLSIIEIMEGPIDFIFGVKKSKNSSLEMGLLMSEGNKVRSLVGDPEQGGIQHEYSRISEVIRTEMNRYTIGELIRLESQE